MLNIKWNSEIRKAGLFKSIYAPPFINDSSSAIGSVCAEWFRISRQSHIDWGTYSGMTIINNAVINDEWSKQNCSIKELAFILASTGEAVVFVNGRSELGPRALGNRSILADPRNKRMKQVLNEM